jgi:hypothetical protein
VLGIPFVTDTYHCINPSSQSLPIIEKIISQILLKRRAEAPRSRLVGY